ncbi:hypothetical protein ACFQVA_05820 [Actinomadura keratinilytica]
MTVNPARPAPGDSPGTPPEAAGPPTTTWNAGRCAGAARGGCC